MGNLLDSIKTPVVFVYNLDRRILATSAYHINDKYVDTRAVGVEIVSFQYNFDDDNDDRCVIRLQASSAEEIEQLGMELEDIISVKWGYINGPLSELRTVVIRDMKSKYGPNVIYTELVCSDMATYLKLTNSPITAKLSPIEYIQQFCTGVLNIKVSSSGKTLYTQGAFETYGETTNDVSIMVVNPPSYPNVPLRNENTETGVLRKQSIYSEDVLVGKWWVGNTDVVRKFMEKPRDLNVMNKSPYTVVYEMMQLCPQGPWFVSGRDNNLYLHNRNLGGATYRIYAYGKEPGYLIDFNAETKYEAFSKNTISSIGIDPLTKSASFLDSYLTILDKLRSFKDIIEDKGITDSLKARELTEWLSVYNNGYQKYKTYRAKLRVAYGNPQSGGMVFPTDKFEDEYHPEQGVASRDATRMVNPIIRGPKNPTTYIDPLDTILFAYQYVTPLTDMSEATNVSENASRKLQMEKEEADAIIEGDPYLMNNINIGITNVQSQHVGNYFVKKCEHTLSEQGYKSSLEMFKVTDDAVLSSYKDDKTYESEIVTEKSDSALDTTKPEPSTKPTTFIGPVVEAWRPLVAKYFPSNQVDNALRIMQAESGGDPNAFRSYEDNPGGGNDEGLFQINSKWHPEVRANGNVFDPEYNIKSAAEIWSKRGWKEWSTYSKATVNSINSNVVTREQLKIKGEEKYKKEASIFRKWNILPLISVSNQFVQKTLTGGVTGDWVTQQNYATLDEYMKTHPDTNATDLVNLYKQGKLKFTETNVEDR